MKRKHSWPVLTYLSKTTISVHFRSLLWLKDENNKISHWEKYREYCHMNIADMNCLSFYCIINKGIWCTCMSTSLSSCSASGDSSAAPLCPTVNDGWWMQWHQIIVWLVQESSWAVAVDSPHLSPAHPPLPSLTLYWERAHACHFGLLGKREHWNTSTW